MSKNGSDAGPPAAKLSGIRQRLSPRRKRDLQIEIGFLEALVEKDPTYLDALIVLGESYSRCGFYIQAMRTDERLVELCPEDPRIWFNLACSYALTGRVARAAEALREAIERGFRDFRWLRRDPDLQKLRRHPLFKEITTKIQSLEKKR